MTDGLAIGGWGLGIRVVVGVMEKREVRGWHGLCDADGVYGSALEAAGGCPACV